MDKLRLVKNAMLEFLMKKAPRTDNGTLCNNEISFHEVCGCPDFVTEGTSAESMASYIMMHAQRDKCMEDM